MSRNAELRAHALKNTISKSPEEWESNLYLTDNTFVKEMTIPAGHVAIKHTHTYSHVSYLVKGQAWVTVDDKTTLYSAPTGLIIEKGKEHAIEALDDVIWLCIHGEDPCLYSQ